MTGQQAAISGALSISSVGEITCVSGSCVDPTYASFLNKDDTVLVGTNGAATSADDAGLLVFTKQTTSYSITNLVGTWQGNGLASGPGAPWWENDTLTIEQDGTCSFVSTSSNKTSGSENGTLSISSGGVITLNLGSTAALGVIDANKTVMVFTNTWTDGATREIRIFTNGNTALAVTAPIIASTNGSSPVSSGPLRQRPAPLRQRQASPRQRGLDGPRLEHPTHCHRVLEQRGSHSPDRGRHDKRIKPDRWNRQFACNGDKRKWNKSGPFESFQQRNAFTQSRMPLKW